MPIEREKLDLYVSKAGLIHLGFFMKNRINTRGGPIDLVLVKGM